MEEQQGDKEENTTDNPESVAAWRRLAITLQRDNVELLAALEKEQEWDDRRSAGALDDDWDYETMVAKYRRAAIAKATQS